MGITIYASGTDPNMPEYRFYQGTETLRFNADEWKYYRKMGDLWVPLDGVTSIVKLITPSKPLMVWAVRKALEKTKALLMAGGYVYSDGVVKKLYEETLDNILSQAKKADEEELEDAGEVGHVAHDHIEKIIKSILTNDEDRRMELLAKLPEDERSSNGAIAAICWIVEHKVRFVSTERRVFDRQHGFAGTCDGVDVYKRQYPGSGLSVKWTATNAGKYSTRFPWTPTYWSAMDHPTASLIAVIMGRMVTAQ